MSRDRVLVRVAVFDAAGAPEAIRSVGGLLVEQGAATPAHVEAMVDREREQPTGLPAATPFALAHSDAPGALRLAVAVGLFASPVRFRRMDAPDVPIDVRMVAALTVPDRAHQATQLSTVIRALTEPGLVAAVARGDAADVRHRLVSALDRAAVA